MDPKHSVIKGLNCTLNMQIKLSIWARGFIFGLNYQFLPYFMVEAGKASVRLSSLISASTQEKPDFVAGKQQRHRPSCPSSQSDQCLCYSLPEE